MSDRSTAIFVGYVTFVAVLGVAPMGHLLNDMFPHLGHDLSYVISAVVAALLAIGATAITLILSGRDKKCITKKIDELGEAMVGRLDRLENTMVSRFDSMESLLRDILEDMRRMNGARGTDGGGAGGQ